MVREHSLPAMAEESLTETLARFLVELRGGKLPDTAVEAARSYVLDWLGSALAGRASEPGKMLLTYASSQPEAGASVIGERRGVSAETAAFVNGGLSHIVEMDDLDRGSVLHPGAVTIPAALAVAETMGKSGRDLLSAVVAGYEVAIRVGEAVGKEHYRFFHNTATCGGFGSAAASAWLYGLDAEETVFALGNAGTQASGLWEFNSDGAMSKHLHAGRAAANGVLAATLAGQGFTGPRRILEGDRGFFRAMAPDAAPERVDSGLGTSPWKILGVSFKPHASCRHTHAAADAALELRPQLRGRAIRSIIIETYRAALALCDRPEPQTPYDAKFSLQYVTACALRRGHAGLTDFHSDSLHDPELQDLCSKTKVRVEESFERRYPLEWPSRVGISLEDGTVLEAETARPKGDPENPMSPAELAEKFSELAAFGGLASAAPRLLRWVEALEESPAVSLRDKF